MEAIAKWQERLLLVMAKYLLAGLAKNKTMEQINRVTIKLLKEVKPAYLNTITFDNGREFCGHGQLSESRQWFRVMSKKKHCNICRMELEVKDKLWLKIPV